MPNFRASVGHNPFIIVKRANPITMAGQDVGLSIGAVSTMFFEDSLDSFTNWTSQGSLSTGTSSPFHGSGYATITHVNGASGQNGSYKQYGTAGNQSTFVRNFYAQYASRWGTFSGGWDRFKSSIFQYHEVAVGGQSNATRKYQVIINVSPTGHYEIELIQWDPDNAGAFVQSAVIQQTTALVRFDQWDILRLQVQLDNNGSGALGTGNGNGIIKLWVNGTLVINSSTVNICNGSQTVGIGRFFVACPTSWSRGNAVQSWDRFQVASSDSLLSSMFSNVINLASWRNSQRALVWDYPPTDALSSSHWRSRMAPTDPVGDNPWEVPLVAQGGGYPYNFSIITGPTGLEIVRVGLDVRRPPYYTYLRYANPQVGTYAITIRCTDQNGTSVDRSWTLGVFDHTDTTRFMYVNSATGNNANTGTRASPKADFNGWWGGSSGDTTHQNKQVFYIGSFNVGGVAGITYAGGNRINPNNNKPKAHIGIGSSSWSGNGVWFQPEGGTGWVIDRISYTASLISGDTNMHVRQLGQSFQYGGMFKTTFIGSGSPSVTGTNSSAFMLADTFSPVTKIHMVGCTFQGFRGEGAGLKNYNGSDVVCEGNTITDSQGTEIFSHKGNAINRCTTRGNLCRTSVSGGSFAKTEWINNPTSRDDIDTCWNLVVISGGEGYTQLSDGVDNFNRNDNYRNNWVVTHNTCDASSGTTAFEDEIIQHSGTYTDGIRNTSTGAISKIDLVTGTTGILNATTGLRIAGADSAHGCELVPL